MTHFTKASRALQLSAAAMLITACSNIDTAETAPVQESRAQTAKTDAAVPASQFDLSHWKLTLPTDDDGNAKADSIRVSEFQSYAHPDFFYLDEFDHMVFTAPNKPVDDPIGYTKYGHYFKAGIYNYLRLVFIIHAALGQRRRKQRTLSVDWRLGHRQSQWRLFPSELLKIKRNPANDALEVMRR